MEGILSKSKGIKKPLTGKSGGNKNDKRVTLCSEDLEYLIPKREKRRLEEFPHTYFIAVRCLSVIIRYYSYYMFAEGYLIPCPDVGL